MTSIKTKPLKLSDVDAFCTSLAKHLRDGDVIALTGDLGAGKTTLVSHIARHLGLKDGDVSSPTYVIHHIYPAKFPIHHIDLYRLENPNAISALGFEEFLGEEGVAFIEWFEKFPKLWTGPLLHIEIRITDMDHRTYTLKTTNPRDHWTGMFDEIQKKWNI